MAFRERVIVVAVILIVEDNFFICELSEIMIQEWGYVTLSASDEDQALSLLRSEQQIDLLFTDINLNSRPLGGCDLAQQAIRLRPKLRVLYTTGNTIVEKMKSLFVDGSHCLGKPYTPGQLHSSFAQLLAA